jgi:hypothetical protein
MINDYLVKWRTANHDNVATQLTHYKTNSFAIQNQASHVTNRTYRLLTVKRDEASNARLFSCLLTRDKVSKLKAPRAKETRPF